MPSAQSELAVGWWQGVRDWGGRLVQWILRRVQAAEASAEQGARGVRAKERRLRAAGRRACAEQREAWLVLMAPED